MKWIKKLFKKKPQYKFTGFKIEIYRNGSLMVQAVSEIDQIHEYNFPIGVVLNKTPVQMIVGYKLIPYIEVC